MRNSMIMDSDIWMPLKAKSMALSKISFRDLYLFYYLTDWIETALISSDILTFSSVQIRTAHILNTNRHNVALGQHSIYVMLQPCRISGGYLLAYRLCDRFYTLMRVCGICGARSGTGKSALPSTSAFSCQSYFHHCSILFVYRAGDRQRVH
jgi:hypothetical protein